MIVHHTTHTHTHTHTLVLRELFLYVSTYRIATVQKLKVMSRRFTMLVRIYISGNFAQTWILNYALRTINL